MATDAANSSKINNITNDGLGCSGLGRCSIYPRELHRYNGFRLISYILIGARLSSRDYPVFVEGRSELNSFF
jgi:hypothetical protein